MAQKHSQNKSKRQRLDEAGARLRSMFGSNPGEAPPNKPQPRRSSLKPGTWRGKSPNSR
jgi:hypothetical protein